MSLDDLERQNRDFLMDFLGNFGLRQNHSQGGATDWRWWRGVVGNAFQLQQSYSTPGLISTAMGDCLQAGTVIGFRASREH